MIGRRTQDCAPPQPHSRDSSAMSGPQTGRAQVTLAASPSNSLESPCQKAGSRSHAVFRPVVSPVREVSAGSASRPRPPTGIVAWDTYRHQATRRWHSTRCLPAASARDHSALRGGSRQSRDFVRRDRRWGACGAPPPPRPEGTPRLPRLRASLPRLCPTEVPCVQRNPAGRFQLQGARVLPIVHGTADECDGRKSDRARAAAFNRAAAVGADLPVLVEAEARSGR